jgi:hypothetical protein
MAMDAPSAEETFSRLIPQLFMRHARRQSKAGAPLRCRTMSGRKAVLLRGMRER